jgi:hypothetical protein
MAKLAIYMNEAGDSVLHRTGFSWLAATLPPLWALQLRLYKTFVATLVIDIPLNLIIVRMPDLTSRASVLVSALLFQMLIVGFGANHYYRLMLERSGYFMTSAEPHRLKGR